jgi:4-hydroxy-2-oxoheptanedioate aldolase
MDEILAVDGIDVFFLGPGDLSHSYGVTGEVNHPLVQGAIDKLAECAAKYNRNWGLPCGPDDAPRRIEQGARFLAAGADVIALTAYFKDMRGGFERTGLRFDAEF